MRAAVMTGAVLSTIHMIMAWRRNLEDHFLNNRYVYASDTIKIKEEQKKNKVKDS